MDAADCSRDPRLLFLWDTGDAMDADPTGGLEPDPLCGMDGLPGCPEFWAESWIAYADAWAPQLATARNAGLRVASPRFHGDVPAKLAQFFVACPGCSKPGSLYFVDALAFDGGVDPLDMEGSMARIKGLTSTLKATYQNRPVVLANMHTGAYTPSQEADVIMNSGLYDRADNPLDAFYWDVYPKAYSPRTARHVLFDEVESGPQKGMTLGQVLLQKCGSLRK